MYLLTERNFKNGFPYYNQNYRKRRLLFNPIIRNLFSIFMISKDFFSYYITDVYYAVLIGDWFHEFLFKFQMTLTMSLTILIDLLVDLLNHLFIKNNATLKSLISNEYNGRIPTANKMKHIFKSFECLFTYSSYFLYFCFRFIFLYRYYTFGQLLTYGLFWSIIMAHLGVNNITGQGEV